MATALEVAAHLDLSDRHVRRLVADSVLPGAKGHGGYNIDDCRLAYIRHLRNQAKRPQEADPELEIIADPNSIEFQNWRLTKARADSEELKNEQQRHKLVPIDLLRMIIGRVSNEAVGIIDTIPLNIKRKHPQLDSQVIDSIKWYCVKAQNSVSRVDDVTEDVVTEYAASI